MDKIQRRISLKQILFVLMDCFVTIGIILFSLWLRFDFQDVPVLFIEKINWLIFFALMTSVPVFYLFNLYRSLWSSATNHEVMLIISGIFFSCLLFFCITVITNIRLPLTVYFLQFFFTVVYVCLTRTGERALRRLYLTISHAKIKNKENVLVFGAGEAGAAVINEMKKHPEIKMKPIVCVDDDLLKNKKTISGVNIVCGRHKIPSLVKKHKIDKIIIAIPSANHQVRNEIWEICKNTPCEIKILPGIYQLVNGMCSINQIRDIQIEDLLGREPISVDLTSIAQYIKNQTIMVTGGAGSIGSELCRQIAQFNPKHLIVIEVNENTMYELQHELSRKFPDIKKTMVIASIRDKVALQKIFRTNIVDIVFHAAAHKHVPLMEQQPCEAVKNNIFGTYNVAKCADYYGVKRFILISTDKAVNPTNIMGATKRVAEMIIQGINQHSKTEFVAVRFGNVLGSNGSVIPLFKKQIQEGGPVTVTHPDVTRYFMMIPEAVQLVIQAGAMANGGEIFVLDMGEPVKIIDLAQKLIQLLGLQPNKDIDIEYVGLRPGEKLYEELLLAEEGLRKTTHNKIFIGKPINQSFNELEKELAYLENHINNPMFIYEWIQQIVKGYHRET